VATILALTSCPWKVATSLSSTLASSPRNPSSHGQQHSAATLAVNSLAATATITCTLNLHQIYASIDEKRCRYRAPCKTGSTHGSTTVVVVDAATTMENASQNHCSVESEPEPAPSSSPRCKQPSTTAPSLEKTTTAPYAVGATTSICETLIWEREGAATCHPLNGH